MQMCNSIDSGLPGDRLPGSGLLGAGSPSGSSTATGSAAPSALSSPLSSPLPQNESHSLNLYMSEDSNGLRESNKKSTRDPLSHRIIEKRRRDRMNRCLTDLSRLIPSHYIKKGRGRIEKTEIVEMAIRHIKQLQTGQNGNSVGSALANSSNSPSCKCKCLDSSSSSLDNSNGFSSTPFAQAASRSINSSMDAKHYELGFRDCINECVRFLLQMDSQLQSDHLCIRLAHHLSQQLHQLTSNNSMTASVAAASAAASISQLQSPLLNNAKLANVYESVGAWPNHLNAPMAPVAGSVSDHSSTVEHIRIKVEEMEVEECASIVRKHQFAAQLQAAALANPVLSNLATPRAFPLSTRMQPPMHSPPTPPLSNTGVSQPLLFDGLASSLGTTASPRRSQFTDPLAKSRSLTSSPNSASNSSNELVYKFKKNIKERFQADLQSALLRPVAGSCDHLADIDECNGDLVSNNASGHRPRSATISSELCNGRPLPAISRRTPQMDLPATPSPSSSATSSNLSLAARPSASSMFSPGFLLHPNGNFYVPIEVQLSPNNSSYCGRFSGDSLAIKLSKCDNGEPNRSLHPISIQVNFGYSTVRLPHQTVALTPC